jgi:hypothetical protein
VTFISVAAPIILVVFTRQYAPNIGQSSGLLCAPPVSSGYTLNGVTGVAGDGFTEMFYMQNYCWESFKSFPVKSVNISGETIAVYDDTRAEQIKVSIALFYFFTF